MPTHPQAVFRARTSLILASGSPRRREMLADLGLPFAIQPAHLDESPQAGEAPAPYALRLALAKARQVGDLHPEAAVIGADTVVTVAGTLFGKPRNDADALRMLRRLQEEPHEVTTGLAVIQRSRGLQVSLTETTRVTFQTFPDPVLRAYIATGEPADKAGAYGIQGKGGFLVQAIQGSWSNVVGLPISRLIRILLEHDLIEPARTGEGQP